MSTALAYLPQAGSEPQWFSAELRQRDGDHWLLEDGRQVRQAVSCLVQPQPGDQVLLVATEQGTFISQILTRSSEQTLTLGQLDQPLAVQGDQLQLIASQSLELGSAVDCDITAASGTLSTQAAQMTTTVMGSWIQNARTNISRFGDWSVSVRELLKLHSKRQQLSADKELKVDADIIHMG